MGVHPQWRWGWTVAGSSASPALPGPRNESHYLRGEGRLGPVLWWEEA